MKYCKNTKNRGGSSLVVLLVLLAIVVVFAVEVKPPTVCEQPLAYDVGVIDNKFEISKEEFLKLLTDAENIWEEGTGMELFTYQPGADFKIDLVFDERQRKTVSEKRAREALDIGNSSYEALKDKYQSLLSIHKNKLEQYDKEVLLYEKKLASYNSEVNYYNSIGGATEKKYKEMEQIYAQLKNTSSRLNNALNEMSALNNNINVLADKINGVASFYNTKVNKYNQTFGKPTIFDQGEYTGEGINVYQFDGKNDLRLVLAHEFGHSLNLNHVENPTSVMYYMMQKQDLKNPALSQEDIGALKTECGLK